MSLLGRCFFLSLCFVSGSEEGVIFVCCLVGVATGVFLVKCFSIYLELKPRNGDRLGQWRASLEARRQDVP